MSFLRLALYDAGEVRPNLRGSNYPARAFLEPFEGYSLFVFTLPSILFILLLVCAIVFVAGVLPALRASRLNPIDALRYE